MKVNENLIWDYSFSKEEMQTEHFKKWYLARVLMRGGIRDIQDVGISTIRAYLPRLNIPKDIRTFWEWHFQEQA